MCRPLSYVCDVVSPALLVNGPDSWYKGHAIGGHSKATSLYTIMVAAEVGQIPVFVSAVRKKVLLPLTPQYTIP
jgi:hypothetical protein